MKELTPYIIIGIILGLLTFWGMSSTQPPQEPPFSISAQLSGNAPDNVTLYSSPDCSCCHYYVQYLEELGLNLQFVQTEDIEDIKEQYAIPSDMTSCHTSIMGTYVVEGHVPVEGLNKLFDQLPDVDGISLPGMPSGSPGMGGDKLQPLVIYSFSTGTTSEFAVL